MRCGGISGFVLGGLSKSSAPRSGLASLSRSVIAGRWNRSSMNLIPARLEQANGGLGVRVGRARGEDLVLPLHDQGAGDNARRQWLGKEVVLVGIDDHFELWDTARWQRYSQQKEPSLKP